MNCEQLETWLVEFGEQVTSAAKASKHSDGSAKSSSVVTEHRRILREEAHKSQSLINYVVCNYEDVDLVHPLIGQILAIYYKMGVGRYFAIQLLPQFMYLYMCSLQSGHQNAITMFETIFLALYNEEILAGGPGSEELSKRVDVFRIPSIRCPSIYHDPVKLNTVSDLPTADYRLNAASSAVLCSVHIGPYPAIETIIGENRFIVLTRLITSISNSIDHLALEVVCRPFCEMLYSISSSSFRFAESNLREKVLNDSLSTSDTFPDLSIKPRIFSPSYFYVEALTVINFCIFNGYAASGLRALDAVHQRAIFDIASEVLFGSFIYLSVTNAMRDLLNQEETRRLIQDIEKTSAKSNFK
ncbi:Hyccin [Aphelenchoides besseyi]|nr:Hyccin [Aphelenchoides besseyi]